MGVVRGTVVVQNNHIERLTAPLAISARSRGIDVRDASFVGDETAFPAPPFSEPVFVYGSAGFVRQARSSSLARFISWNDEAFRADVWAKRLGRHYLGQGGRAIDSGDISGLLKRDGPKAVRPIIEQKRFAGGVYDVDSWAALSLPSGVSCWAVEPSEISAEYRVWVVAGKPVYAAQYRALGVTNHQMITSIKSLSIMALARAAAFLPAIVVDVARLENGGLKVIETNCIHTSGWYEDACEAVLSAWFP